MGVVIACLTAALVRATFLYVRTSEALQKPSVTVRLEPRGDDGAIMDAPHVAQVAQTPTVQLVNVGTGPALNLSYGLRQTNAPQGGPVMHPTGFVNYLASEHNWETLLGRNSLANRTFEFYANYQSLSGKTYEARVLIENGVIKN